ncbi:hypothetical protein AB9H29_05535 [Stenotrophomonas sepilia]|uniref:hypothetical protein n=1 Tax=Stenotrophomonas sepilia TaxID=2860290 RepID=UPI0035583FF1
MKDVADAVTCRKACGCMLCLDFEVGISIVEGGVVKLVRVEYSENAGTNRQWALQPVEVGDVNLVVGKNATGKTRFITLLLALAKLIDGQQKLVFDNGNYCLDFSESGRLLNYTLVFKDRKILSERLLRDGEVMFHRSSDGVGEIFYEKQRQMFPFSVPEDVIILSSRRDRLQHPFIELFHKWAAGVRYYPFGTSLGREELTNFPAVAALIEDGASMDPSKGNQVYAMGYHRWGEAFDLAILADLKLLGYQCNDVGIRPLDAPPLKGLMVGALFVREVGLESDTFQTDMSQGMFRALSMVIHINYLSFDGLPATVLIDDIGEGLDFERSSAFVSLLVSKCESTDLQLLMTTNDRFVMNGVALKHWCILDRKGATVSGVSEKSRPEVFRKFKYLGLNNFDMFSSSFFKDDVGDSP